MKVTIGKTTKKSKVTQALHTPTCTPAHNPLPFSTLVRTGCALPPCLRFFWLCLRIHRHLLDAFRPSATVWTALSQVVYKNRNPSWNQTFRFDLQDRSTIIKFEVYDKDLRKDEFMGV